MSLQGSKYVSRVGMLVQGDQEWRFAQQVLSYTPVFKASNWYIGYKLGINNYFQLMQSDKPLSIEESIPGNQKLLQVKSFSRMSLFLQKRKLLCGNFRKRVHRMWNG